MAVAPPPDDKRDLWVEGGRRLNAMLFPSFSTVRPEPVEGLSPNGIGFIEQYCG